MLPTTQTEKTLEGGISEDIAKAKKTGTHCFHTKRFPKFVKGPLSAYSDRFFRHTGSKDEKSVEEKRKEVTFGSFGQPKEQKIDTTFPSCNLKRKDSL